MSLSASKQPTLQLIEPLSPGRNCVENSSRGLQCCNGSWCHPSFTWSRTTDPLVQVCCHGGERNYIPMRVAYSMVTISPRDEG